MVLCVFEWKLSVKNNRKKYCLSGFCPVFEVLKAGLPPPNGRMELTPGRILYLTVKASAGDSFAADTPENGKPGGGHCDSRFFQNASNTQARSTVMGVYKSASIAESVGES